METENDGLLSKAFALFEDIADYNPKDSPSNGFEYLHQVIFENSKTPQITVAPLDPNHFKRNQTFFIKELETSAGKQEFIPSKDWQIHQINNFLNVKTHVAKKKALWKRKDYCAEINPNVLPSEPEKEESWFDFCKESVPLLSTLFSISQIVTCKLLKHYSNWLNENMIDFSNGTCMWLFSLLACLEEPLLPSTCSDLRSIIRCAKEKRSTIESVDDEILLKLNLIICIAARCYRQIDLCD